MVASGGILSEGYGHDDPGVCRADDQTDAQGYRPKLKRRRAAPSYDPIPASFSVFYRRVGIRKVLSPINTVEHIRTVHSQYNERQETSENYDKCSLLRNL